MLESLLIVAQGFLEIINKVEPISKGMSQKNKKQFISKLQSSLLTVSFYKIDNILSTIISEGKITPASREELVEWHGNTASELDTAIRELQNYYLPESGNSKEQSRLLTQAPKSWAEIQNFRDIVLGKKILRNQVEIYIKQQIGHVVTDLTAEEIEQIQSLKSQMKTVNEDIGKLYDSLNQFLQ